VYSIFPLGHPLSIHEMITVIDILPLYSYWEADWCYDAPSA
jgi:hypothetical protein